MSGIFDKYLSMLNTGSYRTGGGSLSGRSNANKTMTQVNGHDVYIPYEKKSRRSSSLGSENMNEEDMKVFKDMTAGGNMMSKDKQHDTIPAKRLSEPNNRVNF